MTPIEMLLNELESLEKCMSKSIISFNKGEINKELHNIHLNNLQPLIKEYKKDINILKTNYYGSNI